MYAEIIAKNSVNEESSGKTARVWADARMLSFELDEDNNALVITSFCYEQRGISGEYNVERTFRLELDRKDVEKLIDSVLNEKILKKMGVSNLSNMGRMARLELSLEKILCEVKKLKVENSFLRRNINKAKSILTDQRS